MTVLICSRINTEAPSRRDNCLLPSRIPFTLPFHGLIAPEHFSGLFFFPRRFSLALIASFSPKFYVLFPLFYFPNWLVSNSLPQSPLLVRFREKRSEFSFPRLDPVAIFSLSCFPVYCCAFVSYCAFFILIATPLLASMVFRLVFVVP